MNWISYVQLHADLLAFSSRLPMDLVAIVGVPRSGMMAASLLALHRHLPMADFETFVRTGGFYTSGPRLRDHPPPTSGRVLLLDDSANTCGSIGQARTQIRQSGRCGKFKLMCGAVYVSPDAVAVVGEQLDVWYRIVPLPRMFEWNWLSNFHMGNAMCDIDGVLCQDPVVFDDDGPEYEAALRDAAPLYVPQRMVRRLVSCRLERWREVTEDWLVRYGITTGKLVLYPTLTAEARRAEARQGWWKGQKYKECEAGLFVESSQAQAIVIAQVADKPVLCMEDKQMYHSSRNEKGLNDV